MKLLIDFFPIILFFVTFKLAGIFYATAVAILATLIQIAWLFKKNGHVEAMHWISLGVIVVFGGATLLTQNETFIKWKPTILYALMGGVLLIGQFIFKRNFLKSLMGSQMVLPEAVWRQLLLSWVGFFSFMGLLNLWVAYNFDTDTWVNFKMFGGLGLMVVFVILQALFLSRHVQPDTKEEEEAKP
jgi:intracellular septation protein